MVWECFYIKNDSFEIAAWKKSLAGGWCMKLHICECYGKCIVLLLVNWVLLLGPDWNQKEAFLFSQKRLFSHKIFKYIKHNVISAVAIVHHDLNSNSRSRNYYKYSYWLLGRSNELNISIICSYPLILQ